MGLMQCSGSARATWPALHAALGIPLAVSNTAAVQHQVKLYGASRSSYYEWKGRIEKLDLLISKEQAAVALATAGAERPAVSNTSTAASSGSGTADREGERSTELRARYGAQLPGVAPSVPPWPAVASHLRLPPATPQRRRTYLGLMERAGHSFQELRLLPRQPGAIQ